MQKLRCDKLMGQLSRLQTDYDRLSLRNDLGLTKPELEQIAKRMVPPPAKVLLPSVSDPAYLAVHRRHVYVLGVLAAKPRALSMSLGITHITA